MTGVRTERVAAGEDGLRLDRWFRTRFPALKHGQLQKLLRTGQVRVDGGRVKSNTRVAEGQEIRLPPGVDDVPSAPSPKKWVDHDAFRMLADDLKSRVLFEDERVIVLDKPAGLAVQGGSRTKTHIDGALEYFATKNSEKPRLVHRLDRDTSGVFVLARTRKSAQQLGQIFASHDIQKIYWAIVVGEPPRQDGFIDAPLAKSGGAGREQMRIDENLGKIAKTRYRTIDAAGRAVRWLELEPLTGRTHQLRVHCAAMGTPILGDRKYGGEDAFISGDAVSSMKLQLHARALAFKWPDGRPFNTVAKLPEHMSETWRSLGFSENDPNGEILTP